MTGIVRRGRRRGLVPSVFPDIDQMFREMLARPLVPTLGSAEARPWAPQVDLYETENELVVKAELPGVDKGDIDVNVEGAFLSIRAERKADEEVQEERYYRRERLYGSFERGIQLPSEIDEESVSAKYEDGILEVRASKKGPEPKGKKVDIA